MRWKKGDREICEGKESHHGEGEIDEKKRKEEKERKKEEGERETSAIEEERINRRE